MEKKFKNVKIKEESFLKLKKIKKQEDLKYYEILEKIINEYLSK